MANGVPAETEAGMSGRPRAPRVRPTLVVAAVACVVAMAAFWGWNRCRAGGDLAALAKSKNPEDRVQAARRLAEQEGSTERGLLALLAEDGDRTVAVQAIESLGRHTTDENRALLTRLLIEKRGSVEAQAAAASALGRFKGMDPAPLVQALNTRQEAVVRAGAAQGLVRLRDANSIPALVKALEDGDSRVRIWAITAIHKMIVRRFPYDARKAPAAQRDVIRQIRDYLRSCGVAGIDELSCGVP
jgi:HEAT repeat protein